MSKRKGIDLCDFDRMSKEAVMAFWGNREKARQKQIEAGITDQGERAGVTSGKNMDGFVAPIKDLTEANGLPHADIHLKRALLTLPGYFRPTKLWDVLVILDGKLIAAVELKSQVGPSFGNNFNNRTEEAIGTAHDLWTAYREKAFGDHSPPFIGWLMLVESARGSLRSVTDRSPHFPTFPEFRGASYLQRYDLLCQKLVREKLYTSAALITSNRTAVTTGASESLSEMTSLKSFVAQYAAHIAGASALL